MVLHPHRRIQANSLLTMKSLPLGFGAALSILSSLVSVSSQSSVNASVDACGKAANAIANVASISPIYQNTGQC